MYVIEEVMIIQNTMYIERFLDINWLRLNTTGE